MGSLADELSLDFEPRFVPKTISDFLKEVSGIGNVSEKVTRLDGFIEGLEEEMRKIDAFKRELPLCMLLLNDAIWILKEETKQCTARNIRPVFEEFIPLKKRNRDDGGGGGGGDRSEQIERDKEIREKKNWMSSVQLWNADDHPPSEVNQRILCPKHNYKEGTMRNAEESCKNGSASRAFVPFKRNNNKEEISSVQGLSLLSPALRNTKDESGSGFRLVSTGTPAPSCTPSSQPNGLSVAQPPPTHQQTSRKQRRSWSPDLHRLFVNALQQLGGSQVATPKQIRELMQVEGLTNDEVKSHLQKYRLHARKLEPDNSDPTPEKQSAVVLGVNLWDSRAKFGDSSKGNVSQSDSPQGPLQFAATTGGDSMEDEEDAKSECFSWKGHAQKPGRVEL